MKTKLNKKYKITLIIIGILLLFCITIGASYAYWQITHKQTGNNNIASGCFDVTFEETGNDISLSNTFPVSDQEGLSSTPYKFKIKNICTIDSEYYVTLNSFGATDKLLNETSIKYAFDLSSKNSPTPKILGTAPENTETGYININNLIKSYYLKGGHLRAGEEREFSLYLWIDKDAPISEMNKTFSSKIFVTSVATDEAPLIANLRVATDGEGTTNYLNGPLVKNTIEKIEFVETNKVPTDAIGSWDVSAQQNGAIIAWYYDSDKNGEYEVYIGQEEGVIANSNSSSLFHYLENLKVLNLEQLNVSGVTRMSYMFQNCSSLTSLDLSNFDTANVISMNFMFSYCSGLLNLDLSNFNTSKVVNIHWMFYDCSSLTSLDLSSFDTSNVSSMQYMFHNCSNLTSLDLSSFNTSKVTTMYYMFYSAGYNSLNFTLNLGKNFDTSNVTDMRYMFSNVGYNNPTFTLDLGDKFNTSNVTNMNYLFAYTGYNSTVFTLDLGGKFDTSKVTTMAHMFKGTGRNSTVFTLDLKDKFDTSNVTAMHYIFHNTGYSSTVFTLNLGNKFDTSKVTDMSYMFSGTGYSSKVFTLNLGDKFDTSNVTTMYYMFYTTGRNSNIFTLYLGDKFDTSKATNMAYMFNNTGNGNSNFILNLRTFNFDKVTEWENIFIGSKATHTAYVKNATDKTWISDKGFVGTIIDCSANTCP